MRLKQLLAAYGDYKFRVSGKNHTVYVDNRDQRIDVIQKYGDCKVRKFWAYSYDEIDGFISIHIEEE